MSDSSYLQISQDTTKNYDFLAESRFIASSRAEEGFDFISGSIFDYESFLSVEKANEPQKIRQALLAELIPTKITEIPML